MRTYTPRVLITAVLLLLLSTGTVLATGTDQNSPTDIKGHWAEATIKTMVDRSNSRVSTEHLNPTAPLPGPNSLPL